MPWGAFTSAHVKARLAARELEVYEETARREYPEGGGEAAVPVGSPDRLTLIVAQVCDQFRGAIRANPLATTLGAAGTLPDFCIAHAAVVARVALVGMNPVPEGMTDPRRDEYREAMKFLEGLKSAPASLFDEVPASSAGGSDFGGNPALCF
ncbi:MAG: hypothetical protein EOP84_06785 [Verrucomicrobiaceae bacterium]|nr:MAG: hypothetical protein EOP84_06785 [Verrucomicrobiaceae bacterium]